MCACDPGCALSGGVSTNSSHAAASTLPQGYQAGGGGARRSAAGASGGPASDAADLEAGAVVGRYMQQYEQSINPFAGG